MTVSKVDSDSYRRLPRRRFTKAFKRDVVERLLDTGVTVAQLAREHDLHPNQLCRWRNEFLRQGHSGDKIGQAGREINTIEFLPIDVSAPAQSSHNRCASGTDGDSGIGMRILLEKGEIQIANICSPRLLGALLEALA